MLRWSEEEVDILFSLCSYAWCDTSTDDKSEMASGWCGRHRIKSRGIPIICSSPLHFLR